MKTDIQKIIDDCQGRITAEDLERLLNIKSTDEEFANRDARGGSPPLDNSKNQTNKQKNQDEDTKKIITIFDSKCYSPKTEKEFYRLNPNIRKNYCITTFEAFAQYAVYSDEYDLSQDIKDKYNDMTNRLKTYLDKKFKMSRCRIQMYKSNRYNIFFVLEMISAYSFEFADVSSMSVIPIKVLQSGRAIDYLLKNDSTIKALYNSKKKNYA